MAYTIETELIPLPFAAKQLSYDGFDIDDNGNWLALVTSASGLRLVSAWNDIPLGMDLSFAMVRCLNDTALVIFPRIRNKGEINAWIIDPQDGAILKTFSVGDGVEDVTILESHIAVSYFDEGVLSFIPPSQEGIAIFDHAGIYLWGYKNSIHRPVDIIDCYAMCRTGRNRLAFCAYAGFELVELDVARQSQTILPTPSAVHGCGALACLGQIAFLRGPYPRDPDRDKPRDQVFAIDRTTGDMRFAGILPGAFVRGLSSGRMLCISNDAVTIATLSD